MGLRSLGLALALLGIPWASSATSVRSLSVEQIAAEAGLIFEGRVLALRSEAPHGRRSIRTCARFAVLDVLKGEAREDTLELCFAGGEHGGITRRIHGMKHPEPGETGIYFVDEGHAGRVHPLCGWDQGHFRTRRLGDREPEVVTADGRPVLGVGPAGPETGPSRGIARGVRTAEPDSAGRAAARREAPAGLSPAAFKAAIRFLLQGQDP